jgi:hypothetical protein
MQSSDIQEMTRVEKQRNFMRAMSKSIEGRPVTQSERTLLSAIFEALLRGEDVSDLIGIEVPHTRRSADPIHIALHYLCLTQLMHEKAEVAWRTVGDAWGLKKRDVQWVIADHRAPAVALLRQFAAAPDTLLRLCERHARGARPERRRAVFEPPTQSGLSDTFDEGARPEPAPVLPFPSGGTIVKGSQPAV